MQLASVYNICFYMLLKKTVFVTHTQLAPCRGFHPRRLNQLQIKYIREKTPESAKEQNLNLPVCKTPATTYITFTLYLELFTQHLHCIRYYN